MEKALASRTHLPTAARGAEAGGRACGWNTELPRAGMRSTAMSPERLSVQPGHAPSARMTSMVMSASGERRWWSLAEFLVGAAIVIGHNVFHIVPNEVPLLFILGWISIRLRDGGWRTIGLKRPDSWWRAVGWALASAALIILLSDVVVGPFAEKFLGAQHAS